MANQPLIFVHNIWRASYSTASSPEFRGRRDWIGKTGEAFNFSPQHDGRCWGYMPMSAGEKWWPELSLEKIYYAARVLPAVDDVTAVFTAPDPNGGDRVVVGWYRNAAVSRIPQERRSPNGTDDEFYISANAQYCVELSEHKRIFKILGDRRARAQGISGSYAGHSAIFYASDKTPSSRRKL